MNKENWETVSLFAHPDERVNVVASVRCLRLHGKPPRYQVHLGRFNRLRAFSPGLAVVPGESLAEHVNHVLRKAVEYVDRARKADRGD